MLVLKKYESVLLNNNGNISDNVDNLGKSASHVLEKVISKDFQLKSFGANTYEMLFSYLFFM
jgi:hypothetical protein